MTTYYLLRAGAVVSRVVPLWALYALAGLAARLAYLVPTAARAAARANIARAMGRPPRSRAVRRAAAHAFRCQALNYVDLMRMDRLTPAELDASVVRGDLTPFIDTVAAGKGGIVVSGHLGNTDYVGQWLAVKGYPVHTVIERVQPARLFDLIARQRSSVGMQVHVAEPETLRVLIEVLRRGEVVAILADRDITGAGEPTTFFGAPAPLPIGPALLSLRTGAPIIPAFGRRLRDNRLYVTVQPPLQLARTRNLRADLRAGLQAIARVLEGGIAAAPEQWTVFEPIWKDEAA